MGKIIQRLLAITRLELASNDLIPVQDVSEPKTKAIQISELKAAMIDAAYPIGTPYANVSDDRNPAIIFGVGTWEAMPGRVLVGLDGTQPEFDTPGETGGLKETRHGYIEQALNNNGFQDTGTNYLNSARTDLGNWLTGGGSTVPTAVANVRALGAGVRAQGASSTEVRHGRYLSTNLQPYVVVYMWKRVA